LAGPVCAAAFVDRVARPTFVGTETSVRDCRITSIDVRDVRFPTSRTLAGSDAMNEAPDYSAAYVILETDTDLRGYGMTFTCGRGTGRKLVPTVGESENGFRDAMASHQVQGISYGSPPYTGAYALKEAVAILQGHRMPKLMQVPLPLNTAGQLKKCTDVTKGGNAFPPARPQAPDSSTTSTRRTWPRSCASRRRRAAGRARASVPVRPQVTRSRQTQLRGRDP
jgi:hypothetical protein